MKEILRVYGPYVRKQDGRKIVRLKYTDGSFTTQLYAKYIYEKEFGPIPEGFQVDHKNEDKFDDELNNLQILTQLENNRKSVKTPKLFHGVCPLCGKEFTKLLRYVHCTQKRGSKGPFCSRQCAGKFNANVAQ